MGIVINQSIKNTVITYVGFAIGAANTLYMYPQFLGDTFYGLTGYILSAGNILMPLMAFGVHNTIIKYFRDYQTDRERNQFLTFVLLLPLLLIPVMLLLGTLAYSQIAGFLSRENEIIYHYVWQIPVIGLCMGYFEIFYAWAKVHLRSVLGSFIKEVLIRVLVTVALLLVFFEWITPEIFMNLLMLIYLAAMLAMMAYAFSIRRFNISLSFPQNKKAVFTYSLFIILSGSIANILLDLDKTMIGQYIEIETIAYYSVAIFVATVIAVPGRSMHQIAAPVTARLMSEGKYDELNAFYKNTSITLQVVGGFVFLCILANINMLYELMPEQYGEGLFVVFTIGLAKYFDVMLGNNNAIIFNSKYYRAVLVLGIILAVLAVSLNALLIPIYGINGAAVATLISITIYSSAKLMFVVMRMKLFPFSRHTITALVLFVGVLAVFYFWEFPFHPVINIIFKTALITPVYVWLHYRFEVSAELNKVLRTVLGRVRIHLK